MKKIFFGFIRACVVLALILLAASVLISLVSVVGIFIGVLVLCFFVLTIPVLLYNLVMKSKKV
ncbi:hypothetical protein ACNQGP_00785 [Flavobacterium sp. GT2N3]|uniref:hypothetical protein n=1 Tax=unclassified Flavobacterium TaxID=196869 RepID=UPI003AB03129